MENEGKFISFQALNVSAEHCFTIRDLPEFSRFTSCYRKQACWMYPKSGTRLDEIEDETQFLLFQEADGRYVMMIPLLDRGFRCSIRYRQAEGLSLLAESSDSQVTTSQLCGLYVLSGDRPHRMMEIAAADIVNKLRIGRLRKQKQLPEFMKFFGWCTYNAFYNQISHDRIIQALELFRENDIRIGTLIIDAGWQAEQNGKLTAFHADQIKFPEDIEATVTLAKKDFGVRKALVWHTYNGCWRGVDKKAFKSYAVEEVYGVIPDRYRRGRHDAADVGDVAFSEATVGINFYPYTILEQTSGLVSPDFYAFYNDYHNELRKQGIDGVKIDAMAWVECYSEQRGGRVELMRRLVSAAESSTAVHFQGELLSCSSCSNDFIFQSLSSNVTRTSTDYFPDRPESHGPHLFANAHASFWMGEFVQPDWDMFQSNGEAGAFHAAARAISGGPVYIADVPGESNFDIINRLCLSNGEVPLCTSYGKIAADSLFMDPQATPGLLKIFNSNAYSSVIGVFNCSYDAVEPVTVSGTVSADEIDGIENSEFALFSYRRQELLKVVRLEEVAIELPQLGFDLFTLAPIRSGFAPIGLEELFNSGGAIDEISQDLERNIHIALKDGGMFIAYSEREPDTVLANGSPVAFVYHESQCRLDIPLPRGERARIEIRF